MKLVSPILVVLFACWNAPAAVLSSSVTKPEEVGISSKRLERIASLRN
jgi:hypothetical protein